jgi:Acetyltransferase (GNAT) domain
MKAKIVDPASVDWAKLDGFADRTVFQTREWLRFVHETQRAEIIICELLDGGHVVGYFSGLVFSKFGIRMLGSSFPGWTTPYMGFNLAPGAARKHALAAIEELAWGRLKCLHMEVSDPFFTFEDGKDLGFAGEAYPSYRTDLTQSEEKLFDSMDSACRRCIRKSEKSGVVIEEAHDPDFADEYYAQLVDVFAKQGLVPTYPIQRVRSLIKNLEPTGRILLLRAYDAQRKCIATGIFPGFNKIAEFWGNASFRSSQNLRPNEAIHWYAMRYWKKRGVEIYDWGGEGKYKEKYGCFPYRVPWFTKSRFAMISTLRGQAKKMFERKQRLQGWLQSRREEQPVGDTTSNDG